MRQLAINVHGDIVKLAPYRDENFVSTYSFFFDGPIDDEEPSSFNEAHDKREWQSAMDEEVNALLKNGIWDLVPKPKDVQPVYCKWTYKIKMKADVSVDRFKARLIARGFSQKYGEDYEETFSTVAKMTSPRLLLALIVSNDWKLWQLDVKNEFLYGELENDMFIKQPHIYISEQYPEYMCKLKMALYGLK